MTMPHHVYRSTKPAPWMSPPTAGGDALFEDTSGFTAPPMNTPGFYTPGCIPEPMGAPQDQGAGIDHVFSDPVSSVGVKYVSSLANQGKDMVNKEIGRFVAVKRIKCFFDVDTKYVMKKLLLLVFPYAHQAWEVGYHVDAPPPRDNVNAPDLYIPTMAFITYILLAGVSLGLQNRFSPEVLGLCASTALAWLAIEQSVVLLSLYLFTVLSDLSAVDLVAYSGYKYVSAIFAVLGGLLFGGAGYYLALSWSSVALMVFMVRSLKMKIPCSSDSAGRAGSKLRSRHYIIMGTALFQPLIIYWLTSHLVR